MSKQTISKLFLYLCKNIKTEHMKRFTILVAILSLFAGVAGAKGLVSYQGEIDLGYSYGIDSKASDCASIHTIHGIKVGKYFSTGIGIGFDLHYRYDDSSEAIVPLYLNFKGYLPLSKNVSSFLSCDAGWAMGFTGDIKYKNGLTVAPSIGIVWGVFKVQVGYNMTNLHYLDFRKPPMSAVQAKIGIMF